LVSVESEDASLTMSFIWDRRKVLLQEMEPSLLADLLLEKSGLDITEHDEMEETCNRKSRCQVLLSILEKHSDRVGKFGYALQRSKCVPAMANIDAAPNTPGIYVVLISEFHFYTGMKMGKKCFIFSVIMLCFFC
jgi:hypothetical protein